ncbi:putative rhamnosyl transferase [Pontimonas sp.]|nr:putative rhamnosyl transferase [Pontimonas sp.]
MADRDLFASAGAMFLDPDWFNRRLDLFEHYALKSMTRQRVVPDAWLIGVDVRMAGHLSAFTGELPSYADWLLLEPGEFFRDSVRNLCSRFGNDVLTIRLDSDDMVHPTFIARAIRSSRPNRGLNFAHGIQLFLGSGALVHRSIRSNPTVGFRARNCDVNVHDFGGHTNVARVAKMTNIWTMGPLYLKTSHDANVAYFQPNGVPVIRRDAALRSFGVVPTEKVFSVRAKFATLVSYFGFRLNKTFPRLARQIEKARHRSDSAPDSGAPR